MANDEIYTQITAAFEAGESVALATVAQTLGSTPRKAGAKMVIRADGSFAGTVGGGCGEAEVWQEASGGAAGRARACGQRGPDRADGRDGQDLRRGDAGVCGAAQPHGRLTRLLPPTAPLEARPDAQYVCPSLASDWGQAR